MSLPAQLKRFWIPALLLLSLLALPLADAGTASAAPAPGLCAGDASRGSVPDSFAIDACMNSSGLTLRNTLAFPVRIETNGDTGAVTTISINQGIPASVTRVLNSDPNVLMPGDVARVSVGSGAAAVDVTTDPSDDKNYAITTTINAFIPVGAVSGDAAAVKAAWGRLATMISDVSGDYAEYQGCVVGKNWLSQLGCQLSLLKNVSFAVTKALVLSGWGIAAGTVKSVIMLLANVSTFEKWAESQAPGVGKILHGSPVEFAAVSSTPQNGTASSAPPPQATAGNSTQPPASQPQTSPATQSTSAAAAPPAGGGAGSSVLETTGSVAHTWTNYTNAGGYEGPEISKNATIGIACRIQGFAVADGNTWWYRIASSPWNSQYYVSADAFYNNDSTSGSLDGTPYVDDDVPPC